ncbi:exopolyphosphatase [Geobacter sp. DSM 9736]|uniref:Ppx/GppA phosphatase family protein n=1 Tax=Geobacter sp. DSM 9736 TaxID=1277350 RepID=UPI000B4FEB9D|nr:exopolyphosphatase [Geobacter sp. DSM 9736]SNB45615.1 Ppx/GppA phosphatase [Geobacter sp. DSM 9736]
MSRPLAAIDLGTNTARLLIGRWTGSEVEQLVLKRRITRLGGGFSKERGISPEAQMRTVAAMREFAYDIANQGIRQIRAVATSAVRDAANRDAFCNAVLKETGINLEVIDGEEEGLLTLHGVCSGLDDQSGSLLVFDVGGGSTEYTVSREQRPLFSASLPLGVVRLTEGKSTASAMEDKIERELSTLSLRLSDHGLSPLPSGTTLVGTAGTATTLAAISLGMTEYDYRRVNNHILPMEEVRRILAMLMPLTPAERLRVPGLEPGREDLIIAGTLIALKTMELFRFDRLKISDFGLLEGVMRSMLR